MYSIDEIILFIESLSGCENVQPDDDLNDKTKIYGDDWFELIDEYSKKYNVDCSKFIWYFHNREEGFGSIGGIFYKSPDKRVINIPVTPRMLTDFANKGKWDINYPPHKIPSKRYDVIINQGIVLIILLCFLYSLFT